MSGALTCVRGCTSRDRHLPGCEGDCGGCEPRLAVATLQVCARCERLAREWVRELPTLYVDLLTPARSTSMSERVDREISRPALISDRSKAERDSIRACLVTWMFILIEEREMSAPEDTIEAMAHRLAIHVGWLLTSAEHADQLVHDLSAAVGTARRVAYPARPDSQPLGKCPVVMDDGEPCGEMVRARATDELIACRGCGTEAVVEWWQAAIRPDADEARMVTTEEASALLTWRFKEIVSEARIRQWVVRSHQERAKGIKHGQPEEQLPVINRAGRDSHGRTLYLMDDLLRYAETKLANEAA